MHTVKVSPGRAISRIVEKLAPEMGVSPFDIARRVGVSMSGGLDPALVAIVINALAEDEERRSSMSDEEQGFEYAAIVLILAMALCDAAKISSEGFLSAGTGLIH